MKYCSKCGHQIEDEAVVCIHCGCLITNKPIPKAEDDNSPGFNILSFFIPIVGLILYLVWNKEQPIKAKGVGVSAIAGFVLNLIIICISTLYSI